MVNRQTEGAIHRSRRTIFASVCAALMTVAMTRAAQAQCVGDCDGDCNVGISELIRGVNISLGSQALDTCPAFDANADGMVAINELIRGVGNALGGCGEQCVANGSPSPTPTPTTGTTGTPGTQTPGTVTPGTPTVTPPATSVATATRTTAPTPGGGLVLAGANALDTSTVKATFNGAVERASGLDITNYAISEMDPQIAGGPQVVAAHFVRVCDGGGADGMLCNDAVDPSQGDDGRCPGGQCSTEDHRSVLLSTGAHSTRKYKLTVTGVRDTAGNTIIIGPLGDRRNEWSYDGNGPETIQYCPQATAAHTLATGRCEPVRCTAATGCGPGCNGGVNANLVCHADSDCPGSTCGTLPCIAAIPDCDGDGLTDDVEADGWNVTFTLHPDPVNHPEIKTTTMLHVTSNPLRVDTDGDGLPDNEEHGSHGFVSNPRNPDTDGEIGDYQEVVLLRSNPADLDTDADGLSDLDEVTQNGTSPTFADSDGDSIPDGADYQANGGDPSLADLPSFEIQVDNPTVTFKYSFVFTQNHVTTGEETGNITATLSAMSSQSNTTTDTTVKEWSAKAALHAEAEAAYPTGFTASAKVTVDADVGASGRNEVTKQSAAQTANELQKSNTYMHTLMSGETAERMVSDAKVTASVRFANTGGFAMCLDNIIVNMRTPDPANPGEFIPLGTLAPVDENGMPYDPMIELGPLTTTHTVQFSAPLDGQPLEAVQRLMRNPRSIIFDVGDFRVKSDPSGKTPNVVCSGPSYVTTEQNIVNNTGEVTVDFAGEGDKAVQHLFVSSNLGRQAAVRDRNGDGHIDANDEERVVYTPDGTELYPRLTDALDIAKIPYTVDPVSGQFTSVGGSDSETSPHRKAWIILIRNNKRGTSRLSGENVRYCGKVSPDCPDGPTRVDDVAITPGIQIWITYLQDDDKDGVPRSTEDLYGTFDDNHDISDMDNINCKDKHPTGTTDSDCDGVSDFDEIYRSVPVTITNREGESVLFEAHSIPVLDDTDGDGVKDGDERAMHTAPDRKDTDGDGLPDKTDPDPLVYGCVRHLFHFIVNPQPDPATCPAPGCRLGTDGFDCCGANFPDQDYAMEAKPGCSVTIHSQFKAVAAWNDGHPAGGQPISLKSIAGYAACQVTSCAVDSCMVISNGGVFPVEKGGDCSVDQGPGCNYSSLEAVTQAQVSYDVQCGN